MRYIVVHSGGLDSTVLLAHLLSRNDTVKSMSVDYGQRHSRELKFAEDSSRYYGVIHETIPLASQALSRILAGSSQTDPSIPVPLGHYQEENMKKTVVPNRNMILLALACSWAVSSKYDGIAYAAHSGDHAIYPDCREEFVKPLAQAMENADWHKVTIFRPFIEMSKAEIVKLGASLKVPFQLTWSCYKGEKLHCGECGTCVERKEAFQLAGIPDPTEYLK